MADVRDEERLAPGFGTRLRTAREKHPTRKKMTQPELAKELGYGRDSNLSAQISAWEREKESIPLGRRKRLAHVLEVEYDWLVSNRGDMVSPGSGPTKTSGGAPMADLEDLYAAMRGVHARLTMLENQVGEILTILKTETKPNPRTGRTT
jgi:transcriptional regulator with XRE-family HTH domain